MDQYRSIQETINTSLQQNQCFPLPGKVACQGVPGSYSQQACLGLFDDPDLVFYSNFEQVFQAVDQGQCQYGVLPIENSSAGVVNAVYDLMGKYQFYICQSIKVKISHQLLAKKKVGIEGVKEIYSHEQALRQCSQFLTEHDQIQFHTYSNTAAAAEYVANSSREDIAAISSSNCAELYGLEVLQDDLQNYEHNYTRFICIGKTPYLANDADKISLAVVLQHEVGALYQMLGRFAQCGLNLSKIQSIPLPNTDFEFLFYCDVEGNVQMPKVIPLLESLEKELKAIQFLGNYREIGHH